MGILSSIFGAQQGQGSGQDILSILMGRGGGGAGGALSPGASLLDEIKRRGGATPGINPNESVPGMDANSSGLLELATQRNFGGAPDANSSGLSGLAAQGNFGGVPAPTSNLSKKQVAAVQSSKDPMSLANLLLSKAGGVGQKLMPISNFLGKVSNSLEGSARAGHLGALAPNFQAGVQGADDNALNKRFIQAQIDLLTAKTSAEGASGLGAEPLSAIGKLGRDLANGAITPEIYQAEVNQILDKELGDKFDRTQKLRGEFSTQTKPIADSLQSLSAASSLINSSDNPISELAAFISTIKSIDNSTVREGELAAFNEMQGFLRKLENEFAKAKGEGFSETLRRDIAGTITSLEKPLRELLGKKQEFYRGEANKFKLDPESIAGSPFAQLSPGRLSVTPKPSPVVPPVTADDEAEDTI